MSQLAGNAKQPVHLGVMVRAEQRRELAKLAEREDRSVSSVTRAAIDAYLARQAQPGEPWDLGHVDGSRSRWSGAGAQAV